MLNCFVMRRRSTSRRRTINIFLLLLLFIDIRSTSKQLIHICLVAYDQTSASVNDWCMSPHGIAGPPTKVHQIRAISVEWPDPNDAKFRRAPTKSAPDVRFQKILTPYKEKKLDQNSPKSATDQCPSSCQISSRSAERCARKVLQKCYPPVNFGAAGGPIGPKFTSLGTDVQ